MRDSETTNLLLLLILFVLLIGFGFLVPILWIVGAVIGLWVSAIAIGTISRKIRAGFEAVTRSSPSNDAVQWCFISVITMGVLIWSYFDSSNNEYLFALIIPVLFALIKYWDTVSIRRKYRKVNTDDS